MPLEHFAVVKALRVVALTIIFIRTVSFSFWGIVAGDNSIEFKGVIEIYAFF